MRQQRAHRSAGFLRSVTLLRVFLLASAGTLVLSAVALSLILERDLRRQALEDNAQDFAVFVNAVLEPRLLRGGRVVVTPKGRATLAAGARKLEHVQALRIWSPGGKLMLSTSRRGRERHRALAAPNLRIALQTREPQGRVVDRPGAASVVEIFAPLVPGRAGATAVGAVQIDLDASVLDEAVGALQREIWMTVAFVFAAIWLVLALLVRGASSRLHRQNEALDIRSRELNAATRQLETTLLETIETLNAAVEARDPYTAGHSLRVRRVALALGRELGLSPKQLGALGTAAIFHDVGKIGMPDSILTKPERLTREEAVIMREHVVRGAEIVSRIESFRDVVPIIRHHHERWDGLGYPDGLSGSDIRIESAIIALADAWDAMTTDRPYAVAAQLSEALAEIRTGRGKQFNPAVVDAFAEVAKRRPAEVLPPEAPTASVAVV